jgi:hypothetical protein
MMWGKIIGLPDLGCCFVTLKPHIYYCNILLWNFAIFILYCAKISVPKWNSQNSCSSQVKFIIRKWEWHVSVTAVLNFPLEVWRRTLHRPLAINNVRQQFWTFSILLYFVSLVKKVWTERGFCWANMLLV